MGFGGIIEGALSLVSGSGNQPVETPSALVVEELGGQKRKVELIGRGLPYRPFELPVAQRVVTTWLPGFAEATATVLGARDDPSTLNGFWKDRFIQKPQGGGPAGAVAKVTGAALGAVTAVSGALSGGFGEDAEFKAPIKKGGKPVESVRDAAELFDSITREGQEVQVTWDAQCRRGFLKRFVPRWHNAHDCEWEMEFEWISRGEKPRVAEAERSAAGTVDEIRQVVSDLGATLDEVGAITDELDDRVQSQMQALNSLVEKLGDAVASVNKLVNLPSSATRRMVATLNSVVAQALAIADSFELQPFAEQHRDAQRADGFGSTSTRSAALIKAGPAGNVDYTAVALIDGVQIVGRAAVAHKVKRAARRVASAAALRRSQLVHSMNGELRDVYTAKEGEHLRDVAEKVAGNPDEWRRIMLFNGLSSAKLSAGQVVLVPRASAEGFCASLLP